MKILFLFIGLLIGLQAFAQEPEPVMTPRRGTLPSGQGNGTVYDPSEAGSSTGTRKDSIPFEHRDDAKDSISVIYRYLDSTNKQTMDSSVRDFDNYYSLPSDYQNLGINGSAAFPLIFQPNTEPGWDAGFHAFDVYKFKIEDTKFYTTRRPFTTFGYQLASGKEQMIQAGHTQSPRPNINFGFNYRLISSPGFFKTQNNTHNSTRLYGYYQGPKKRYSGTFIFQGNNIKAAQNGGIVSDSLLLDPNSTERFSIPVKLGNDAGFSPNPFNTSIKTGNIYKQATVMLRQSYDLGKNDSLQINDSTMEYLFYPKLRIQHTFTYNAENYLFNDYQADSSIYASWYKINLGAPRDTLIIQEKWHVIRNDFSLIQFPDTKNASQFLLAGVTLENISRQDSLNSNNLYNAFGHAEYRNRTRNKLWDILASGELYLAGLNSGDYKASASISRYLNPKLGNVKLFFTNTNRRPSFIFDNRSAFQLGNDLNLKKENIVSFGATASNKFVDLMFANHFITNYAYFTSFTEKDQYSKPINVLQVGASKKVRLAKHINWYPEVVLQQTDAAAPIRVPFFYSRNRVMYEGNFFKNLFLSTGIEARYYSPYKMNNYSPLNGQFVPQDTMTISNLPDVNAFVHLRIKGFTLYFRAENLNTASFSNGFGFVNNNFGAPHYPTQGLALRFGIRWWFIN